MDINFDKHNKYEIPSIYLCNPNKKQLCTVQGINSNCILRLNSLSEISLEVRKTIQNLKGETIKQPCYDLLEGRRLLFVEGIGYFEIKKVVENDDDTGVYKTVTAESHQVVLQNKNISTEEKVYLFYNSADPLDENYNPDDASSVPSIVGQLYQQLGIKVELQDQDNATTQDNDVWTITYIDDELRYGDGDADGVYRSFKENTTNGYDFMVNEVEAAYEAIWIFDYMYHTIQIKKIKHITVPTDIYLSFDNLLNTVEVTEDASNIVTVLNCKGSDLDIRTVNPMGTNYLVNFDFYKDANGKWMSEELIDALDEWKAIYDSNVEIYKELVLRLRSQYGKQTENNRVIQESQLKIDELSQARDQYIMNYPLLAETVYQSEISADIYSEFHAEVLNVNKVYTCYKKSPSVENQKYIFSGTSRIGSLFENYENEYFYFQDNDTNTYCKIIKSEDGRYGYERYGQYDKIIEWCDCSETNGIVIAAEQVKVGCASLLEGSQFYSEAFKKNLMQDFTCYDSAPIYKDGNFQFDENTPHVVGTLDECGYDNYLYFIDVSGKSYCKIDMAAEVIDGKEQYYASGFTRFALINEVTPWIDLHEQYNGLVTKDNEYIQSIIDDILVDMQNIHLVCNVQKYIKSKDATHKLLNELESYWVEGDYENTNLAVLDDTTMEEVLDLASELKDDGEKQLSRVSQPSFSFTISAIDFFKQIKFKKFASQLKLGRVITIEKSEGVFYTPAVTEFGFNLDNGEELTLTFSNSARLNSNDFTFADLVVSAAKVTKSVTSNWQDLIDYTKHKEEISSLIANPLSRSLRAGLTNMANQEFTIDHTGILGRKYTDDSKIAFSDEQMRIMNNTILFTDDNWSTIKTALGRIYYDDDSGVEKTAYGLVAQTIIGNLMMSETLKITNGDSSILLDESGLCIKHDNDIVFNADTTGNVSLVGHIEAKSGYIGTEENGFLINENFISHNLGDVSTRILIGTGADNTRYTITNHSVNHLMLMAGENFGVTRSGDLYANSGYIAELQLKKAVYTSVGDGEYVRINGELVLYSSLDKYLKVYSTDEHGDYVIINGEYVLGSTLNVYNAQYIKTETKGAGEYFYIGSQYVLVSSVTRYHLEYIKDSSGDYVLNNGQYVLKDSLKRFDEKYVESEDGEYVLANGNYILSTSLPRYSKEYNEASDGIYVFDGESYVEYAELTKYSLDEETGEYVEDVDGEYISINSEYILLSEATKYSEVYTEITNGDYVLINNTYILYENLPHYSKTYEEKENGLYTYIDGNYVLYASLTFYKKQYAVTSDGEYILVNREYVLFADQDTYDYYYDVIIDNRFVPYSSLKKYSLNYELNANGNCVYINNKYVDGEELARYNADGTSTTESATTQGMYGDGFKIETSLASAADEQGSSLLAFWDEDENYPETRISSSGIHAKEGYFDLLNAENINGENIKTQAGLVMSGKRISNIDPVVGDNSFIEFGFVVGGTSYYAKLWWDWYSRILNLNIYDQWGNSAKNTGTSNLTFVVNYAVIWGGNKTWYATVSPGSSGTTKDTNAFWGIDYATFSSPSVSKNNRTYWFTQGGTAGQPTIGVQGNLMPYGDNKYNLGTDSRRWQNVYSARGVTTTSDRKAKNTIEDLTDKHSEFFDLLRPVSFKYNENTHNRTHIGLIANEVKDAILEAGFTTQEIGAYVGWTDENGEEGCGLRYGELVSLNIYEIQKLKARVSELERIIENYKK